MANQITMELEDFIKTIYLGDQACKAILLDSWNEEIKIQATCISRVRSGSWNYYTDEDIENGYLIFEKAKSINFDPPGFIPNDFINDFSAEKLDDDFYAVTINISSINSKAESISIDIRIVCKSLAIEDPKRPGFRIKD
ncbi:DUF6258 family protein [Leptospira santarosai]|uniref:DUF6258 family protein n=2 Tax=Leptospira santarosai TaxID=28183 RepID=UPI00035E1FE3|nr:DUF6258 family protein [Leptospira santarosai]MDI7226497.1 DUF6258 family protein [Leptospira santarosai]